MRRLATLFAAMPLFLLAPPPAAAQTGLALTGGVNIVSLDVADDTEIVPDAQSINRISLGLTADFSLSERFGLRLGGHHSQKGSRFEFAEDGLRFETTTRFDYLEFTALGRMRFPLAGNRVSLDVLTGPAVGVETSCELSASARDPNGGMVELNESCDGINLDAASVDIGWVVGGGLDIGITDHLTAAPGLLYTRGLIDIDTAPAGSLKHRALTLQIGIGYTLR